MEYMNVDDPSKLTDATIRMGYATSSNAAIYQVQDILGLDNSARVNESSTVGKNWQGRLANGQLTKAHMERVECYTCIYGRD